MPICHGEPFDPSVNSGQTAQDDTRGRGKLFETFEKRPLTSFRRVTPMKIGAESITAWKHWIPPHRVRGRLKSSTE